MKSATQPYTPLIASETEKSIRIVGIGTYAPRPYSQAEIIDILGYHGNKIVDMIVQNAAIETRCFHKTPVDFGAEISVEDLSAYHRHYAPLLAAESLHAAAGSQFSLDNLDALVTTTSTGYMSPGIAEVLHHSYQIGRSDTFRYNLVGHGCSGAVPALQIAQSLLLSGQARYAAVVCTEAVAALFNPTSHGKMAIVQHLIFGEGGAALILGEGNLGTTPYPMLIDSYQELASDSLDAVTIRQNGFWESVTDRSVPDLVGKVVPNVIQNLLDRHNLMIDDVKHWVFHTGGRKILEACQSCLGLSHEQMQISYDILLQHGNMLSASVLFSLDRLICTQSPQTDDYGVLVALGPGITAGAYLMKWT
jgi:predicted naringenin-chalcone synthase